MYYHCINSASVQIMYKLRDQRVGNHLLKTSKDLKDQFFGKSYHHSWKVPCTCVHRYYKFYRFLTSMNKYITYNKYMNKNIQVYIFHIKV